MELPSLPLPVAQNVFAFAVAGYADYEPPEWRDSRVVPALKAFKLVSKSWTALMREIVHLYQDSTLVLRFKPSWTPLELPLMYQTVSEIGSQITELFVCMGTIDRWSQYFSMPYGRWDTTENININWSRVFANLPALKTLNLEANYMDSRHVFGALDAASTHCINLETLVLPAQQFGGGDERIQAVLGTLYTAMKRWRLQGNRGGLRHLKVPLRFYHREKFKTSKEFFDNVVENCPNVEYLDGYKASLSKIDALTCSDTWLLMLEDWEKLNATCTRLREFDWVVVPFADPFFRVFGQYVKPQMKKLTFGVNMYWNWRCYFYECSKAAGVTPDDDWDDDNFCNRQGYGLDATDPAAALKGCPLLDEVIVKLYHAVDRNMYIPPDMGDVDAFPEVEMVNQDVFGDHFCETLASQCPFLTRFVIEEVGEYFNRKELKPISTFTDRGLMALTQLKYLRCLQLRSINCTGQGLLELLNTKSNEFTGNRSFEITVGGCPEDSKLVFYEIVKQLLTTLADTLDMPCTRQKFALRIENWSYNSRHHVDPVWSETYLSDLEELMNRVKDAHPSLRQHVVTMDRSGKRFSRIAEFGLYTTHMEPSVYCNWEDWEHEEENKGITIVDREDLLADDRSFNDDASDFYGYDDEYLGGNFYDGEGESDIDSEYLDDDSDFEM